MHFLRAVAIQVIRDIFLALNIEKACYLEYGYLDSRKRVDRNGYLEGIFVSKTDVSNFISKAFVSMKVMHIRKVLLGTCR